MFYSLEFYEEGGPVFIRFGGEAKAASAFLQNGIWVEWAVRNKAALFLLEHRYYGLSQPTEDLKTANLQWLSSR